MEKKEARIKCSGCGTSYKVKIPVTDKPVSFKCKKCGKVLKLKVKAPAPPPPPPPSPPEMDFRPPTNFETTQLPDEDTYQDPALEKLPTKVDFVDDEPPEGLTQPSSHVGHGKQWMVLAQDAINGPFTNSQVVQMIHAGEITAQTSLRMGERPWVKASEIAEFKTRFAVPLKNEGGTALETISLLDRDEDEAPEGRPLEKASPGDLGAIVTYPIAGGRPIPLAIFAAFAFVASTAMSFELTIGLPLSIVIWIILYGYLSELLNQSMVNPQGTPPDWNFAGLKDMVADGIRVFVVLLVYVLIPMTLATLGMVYFFLNNDETLGYALMALTVVIYLGALFVVPAGLVIAESARSLGSALNPGKVFRMISKGGKAYLTLAVLSIVIGLPCLFVTVLGIYLGDVIPFGFVVSGLLMALVLSYAHFVWFHALGRFSGENKNLLTST